MTTAAINRYLPAAVWLLLLSFLLGGCLYPEERRAENQVPSTVYLEMTQKAIEQYQADQGVLPIVTKEFDTPIFEKYEIDFKKLIPKYLPDYPGNSFEKGGMYKYVLIDVETKPTVRLIHLGIVSQVADVQLAVNRFYGNHEEWPIGQEVASGYHIVDFNKLNRDEQQVESLVTNQLLPFVISNQGVVGIDYGADIAAVIRSTNATVPENTDPRHILARESLFVPIKSFAYTMKNDQPVLYKQ
ncbi:hypothetical protein LOK74_09995 [Brevibacillus humidisoli]|uniref:hypothetical protein n=1 Tax=Brevibacillus humidisoli TaxID=2895522 RepID=UPI001E5A14CB|nr:hypothetical protein [Brevibacillus humidisoli]UFJ42795.1 hypothetical protein LOK74_09995 [Brevibacillus humidisoli]